MAEQQQALAFRKVADLKGVLAAEQLKQSLRSQRNPQVAKAILNWAEPKKTAICFIRESTSLIYTGGLWYEATAAAQPGWWQMNRARPELALAYIGTVDKLRRAVTAIAAKKQFVITAVNLRGRRTAGRRPRRGNVVVVRGRAAHRHGHDLRPREANRRREPVPDAQDRLHRQVRWAEPSSKPVSAAGSMRAGIGRFIGRRGRSLSPSPH